MNHYYFEYMARLKQQELLAFSRKVRVNQERNRINLDLHFRLRKILSRFASVLKTESQAIEYPVECMTDEMVNE